MKRYEKYKPSGIEWIGEIPEHWKVIKIKYSLGSLESGSRETGGGNLAEGVFSLGGEHIGWYGELLLNNSRYIPEEYFQNLRNGKVKTSDVLLVKDGATIGKCAIVKKIPFGKCAVNEHVFILRVNHKFIPEFIFYYIWCDIGRKQILSNIRGSAQPGLNSNFINEVIVPILPKDEQTAIANYLDDKTSQIDTLIANKQKLIELLKEEQTAIINHAVTKGINPKAKLKPSGIEWLGDIPEHWEVKRLKYVVSKVGSGITPAGGASVYQNEGIPLLRSQNIFSDVLKLDDVAYISEDIDEQMSNSRIEEDDVLLNITGASIGRCFYVPKGFRKGNVNQHVCVIRPIQDILRTKFLHSIIISGYGQTLIDACQTGANREGLNFQQIKAFDLPMPDIKEQEQIVDFIESHTTRIDAAISKIEKEIGLLQEYRTALVSEAVTGKIRVA